MSEFAFTYAILAGILDVGANLASTKSKGFSKRGWGLLSILLVLAAFGCLTEAVKFIDLAVAYAILGATGIFGTAFCSRHCHCSDGSTVARDSALSFLFKIVI